MPMKLMPKDKSRWLEHFVILAGALLFNQAAYNGARLFTGTWYHTDITSHVDDLIPLVPWTVVIYFGCYIFWGVNYCLCANQGKEERDRYFAADTLAKIIAFVIFMAFPTTNVRPEIAADQNVFNLLMRFLYWIDTPDNLFPSLHCLVSWLCWVGVRKRRDIPAIYRWFSLVAALAVCVSTLTTKQHVLIDVFSGVFLAEFCYFICRFPKVRAFYPAMLAFVLKPFRKKNTAAASPEETTTKQ